MATVSEVIIDALDQILVRASESPLEADETQSAIRALNNMMTAWDADGLPLGFELVTGPGDPVTVPDSTLEAIIFNLAVRLAPQFGVTVGPGLAINARQSFQSLTLQIVRISPSAFPSNTPVGTGVSDDFGFSDERFFKGREAQLENELDGAILLETGTEE